MRCFYTVQMNIPSTHSDTVSLRILGPAGENRQPSDNSETNQVHSSKPDRPAATPDGLNNLLEDNTETTTMTFCRHV
ncbi:hypothetical protein UPYG_G00165250 [Umbra pygmaea]|uniref:Uncharacterized protein n=1 Tax=Umbra pygmaea TaxID=75934 RepID=A0ABD0XCS6_UMBPY